MDGFRDELYGERAAHMYDDRYADFLPSAEMLTLLRDHAGSGPVVEIGVGTGRVAIPLARSGIRVIGVDVSAAMIDRLRKNAASLPIDGVVADAGSFVSPEPATLIYCVFNTLYQLGDSGRQMAFLRNVADNLADDGVLIIEMGILRPEHVPIPTGLNVTRFDAGEIVLQVYSHDAERRTINKQEAILRHGEPVQLVPSVQHYLSAEQLVTMAAESGLVVSAQYGTWSREPFTADSENAITILRRKV